MAWVEYSRDAIGNGDGKTFGTIYYRCSRCKLTACVPLGRRGEPGEKLTPCSCETKR